MNATTRDQLACLVKMYESNDGVDFWTQPSVLRETDIMVSSDKLPELGEHLKSQNITFKVLIEDVDK
jgi:hypothetical protein